jgi:hypothetical protein
MSEIAIKPWMRPTDETGPVPNVIEATMVYHALRSRVETEFRESEENIISHRPHKGDVCEMVIELETDDDETIEFTKRQMPGVEEHEIAITSPDGVRNTYIGSSHLQLVTRTDKALPNSSASIESDISTMEGELEQFLRDAAGESASETATAAMGNTYEDLTTFGVTVGQPEIEHFLLYLSDDSVE